MEQKIKHSVSEPQKGETSDDREGQLKIIMSMMYGGKTTYLIHIIEAQGWACSVLYINHALDTRDAKAYSTHSTTLDKNLSKKLNSVMIKVASLAEIDDKTLLSYPVVCIDEAQFFPDLDERVRYMVNVLGLEVYVAGLNGDYKRRKFGQILDLVPDADDVIILKDTLCSKCALKGTRKTAKFTWRVNDNSKSQVEIGSQNYIPVCRGCHNSLGKLVH